MYRSLFCKCLVVLSDKLWLKSAVQLFTHACPMGTIYSTGTEEWIGRYDEVCCRFAKANKNGKTYKEVEFPIFYCRPHFFLTFLIIIVLLSTLCSTNYISHLIYWKTIFPTSLIGKQCDKECEVRH
jgi:hypothetical protein